MFGFIFEIIIFIVIVRALRDSKKNKQRKQASAPKPPVPNQPAPQKAKTGWTPTQKKPKTVVPNQPNPEKKKAAVGEAARTFVEPVRPVNKVHTAGERYEEWMPVPDGKKVCRCGYCAADNLIPKGANPKDYSCYFCREEL